MGVADFELLNLVGKGSFGKVIQVRKIDSGEIFAMKVYNTHHYLHFRIVLLDIFMYIETLEP